MQQTKLNTVAAARILLYARADAESLQMTINALADCLPDFGNSDESCPESDRICLSLVTYSFAFPGSFSKSLPRPKDFWHRSANVHTGSSLPLDDMAF